MLIRVPQYTEQLYLCIVEILLRWERRVFCRLFVKSLSCQQFQHQGFGTLLMEEAERIAREEHGSKKLAVISGVGVRSYYARLGYQ